MSKVHKSNADPRSRSDSFVRMLELEKIYQMQRLQQHDRDSVASTSNPQRASYQSVVADPPVSRSRRTTEYPPISNQPQIMKANRRSTGLPPLSVSIPPSPTQASTMRSKSSAEDIPIPKEEHAKTVTFSEPDDEDSSDNSSICQSPSWDKWDKKKPKKPKKGDSQKNSKESDDKALKKKSNRLIKTAPTDTLAPKPLATSDRSISTPELVTSAQSGRMDHSAANESDSGTKRGRPKSRGFLSSFRSDGSTVRGFMGVRKGTDKGADDSVREEASPTRQTGAIRPGSDETVQKSKKSQPAQSNSSSADPSRPQEKHATGSRPPSSSGHSRSQSLLSSTLNRLRGASYFHHHGSGDSSANKSSKQSNGSQGANPGHEKPKETPNEKTPKSKKETSPPDLEGAQQSFDFAFTSKPVEVNMEPGPDIAPRGRQPRPRKAEAPPPNPDQQTADSMHSSNQRVQIASTIVPTREAVTATQDRQTQTVSQQTKVNPASGKQTLNTIRYHQSGGAEPGTRSGEIQQLGNTHVFSVNPSDREKSNENVKVDAGNNPISVDTYASTRPVSQGYNNTLAEGRHQKFSGKDDPASAELEVRHETTAQKSDEDLSSFETDAQSRLRQSLQSQRDVDFFEYFSEAYVPPVLDLQSPNEHNSARPPRFPFPEESDEDSGSGDLRNQFINDHTKSTIMNNEGGRRVSPILSPPPKDIGRALKEQRQKDSPAISIQCSDSDVPTFERLGLSSKSAKMLGAETAGSSTTQSQKTDPSRATSERSSSSTCDDSPPSPSSVTTPDSSRPQSRKGPVGSHSEASQTAFLGTAPQNASRKARNPIRGMSNDRFEQSGSRSARPDANTTSNGWRQGNVVPDVEQLPAPTSERNGGLTVSLFPGDMPTPASFSDAVAAELDEANEHDIGRYLEPPSSLKAQSAVDLHSSTKLLPRSLRPQPLQLKSNAGSSSVSLPNSPPLDFAEDIVPLKSALKTPRTTVANGPEPSTALSVGAAYLQEARKTAPVLSASASRALRPPYTHKSLSGSMKSVVSTGSRAEPLAKMLVECCNCHFFHDMPSRVYECIAKPDTVVEDKSLGVSAAITRMVKCPWCSHGMTTQCCSGYAAVIYLQEKLHGK